MRVRALTRPAFRGKKRGRQGPAGGAGDLVVLVRERSHLSGTLGRINDVSPRRRAPAATSPLTRLPRQRSSSGPKGKHKHGVGEEIEIALEERSARSGDPAAR